MNWKARLYPEGDAITIMPLWFKEAMDKGESADSIRAELKRWLPESSEDAHDFLFELYCQEYEQYKRN